MKNLLSILALCIYSGYNCFLWLTKTPELTFEHYRTLHFIVVGLSIGGGIIGLIALFLDFSSVINQAKQWTAITFFLILLYSAFTWYFTDTKLPPGVMTVENGKYLANNHGSYSGPYSKERYFELTKYEDLQLVGGIGLFLTLGILVLNLKEEKTTANNA